VHRTTVSVNRWRAPAVLDLDEDAREVLQDAGVWVAHDATTVPRSRRRRYKHDVTVPRSSHHCRASLAPPQRCCLAHAAVGMSTTLPGHASLPPPPV
jgi:hypothetical protein